MLKKYGGSKNASVLSKLLYSKFSLEKYYIHNIFKFVFSYIYCLQNLIFSNKGSAVIFASIFMK